MAIGEAKRDGKKESMWRQQVAAQAAGDLSIRAFCKARGLSEQSFHWWRRELRRRDAQKIVPAFMPVEVRAAAPFCASVGTVEIVLPGERLPAKLTVIGHVRLTYACKACELSASESGPQIVTAELPRSPIEKGLAASGLLAQVIVSKYADHLPLHRLERIFERHGIDLSRSTMCDWMRDGAQALKPLYDLMVREVLQSKVIHTDDTSVQVLDRKLPETRTGRFWVYLGDHDHPYCVFDHTATRQRDGPMKFLNGWGKDRRVYLQADAYGGYDGIHKGEAGGQVTEVACWAHARRKFYDAKESDLATATQALAYIRLLYDAEDQARELTSPQRAALRQQLAVPRLKEFRT